MAILLNCCAAALLSISCANQVALTGGPRDEVPPALDTAESSKNYSLHFTKQDIELVFDEFIDLRDANSQIVISPPLEYPPRISSRLKKVKIEFNEKEELKEEATYVINFGKSIGDFTERNELLNFTFVFSTGAYIDSLSLSGQVVDAFTMEPKEDAVVLLYTEDMDSIIFKERPFYFARTDESGMYRINNLRSDTFKIVTLEDLNLNYLYDPVSEQIGFLDSLIVLRDTLTRGVNLEMFKEGKSAIYKSYDAQAQGLLRIDFDRIPDVGQLIYPDSAEIFVEQPEGTEYLNLWYAPRSSRSIGFQISEEEGLDTIQARVNTRTVDTLAGRISVREFNFDAAIGLHPADTLKLEFDRPVRSVSQDLIFAIDTLTRDTIYFDLDTTEFPGLLIRLAHTWELKSEYVLQFLPGAIIDYFNIPNDTIVREFKIADFEDFGQIQLQLEDFEDMQYVFQLQRDDKRMREVIVNPFVEDEITFEQLVPGNYSIVVIKDEIANGKWDPGDYFSKRQSERRYTLTLEELRANWVLERSVTPNDLNREMTSPRALHETSDER